MKEIVFILVVILLGATFALSQVPDQPYHILNVGSPVELHHIMEYGTPIAYSPEGNLLAIASQGGIYLYNTRTWDEPHLLIEGHMFSVAFSQDGTMLASGGSDKVIHLWDLQSEDHLELEGHEDSVLSVCFSPDSQVLVSGSRDSSVRFWSVGRKEEIRQVSSRDTFVIAYSLAYRPDGSMLGIGEYSDIILFDPVEQQILSILSRQDEVWPELWILCMQFSPDGKILAAGSGDNTVDLWEVSELTRIKRLNHNGNVRFVSFTPDGRQLVYGGWGRVIRVYDMVIQDVVFRRGNWPIVSWESNWTISAGILNPDGRTLVTASPEGIISFWAMPGPVTGSQSLSKKPIGWGMLKKMIGE